MTGSDPFLIESNDIFEDYLQKLLKSNKSFKNQIVETVGDYLEKLITDPYLSKSHLEPVPKSYEIREGWTFRKLAFTIGKGASGQIRLMYLVNEQERIIRPLWVYNHEQFEKRPPDKELKNVL